MPTLTIDVPEDVSRMLAVAGGRLPELLRRSLQEPTMPVRVYRYVLDFLARQPSTQEIAAFAPSNEMTARLRELTARSKHEELTPSETAELDEYEQLEHLMILIKSGALRRSTPRQINRIEGNV